MTALGARGCHAGSSSGMTAIRNSLPKTCHSGSSNRTDTPLDFTDKASIGAVTESRRQTGRTALTDVIGRALGGGIGTMPLSPRSTIHDRYDRSENSRQQARH